MGPHFHVFLSTTIFYNTPLKFVVIMNYFMVSSWTRKSAVYYIT